ncbi:MULTISPECIES: AtpZ/AtpI family protein [Mesorhizobium]|jgi:ATP synthase protein I|uniref:ATP synthase protein I n=1 Tax=Rhizobium loti TaxID=381 RepID=A0A8E3B5Y1_RHILI|nr:MULTISPECIES: AtpZ/AtpI family protein [Mesorhizobium]PWJ92614.1 ATP synthase protein I [Mesorhizobium loti]RUX87082.1 ATP F0F1 synthase subunit I [Mesorhizobium sp. M7D.F.Ca.US.004.01.2.1]RVA29726.1 ATP F0F1 synthase subunit I [Mesorhizobium sp. M7D.F.Ca.US.004.03.1.1]
MADKNGPDGTGETGRGKQHEPDIRDDDLERRRRDLEASLATRRPDRLEGKDDAKAGSAAGYGQAVKLSSEFIAGVVVGAGIGWIIDRMAGTSPLGLIVFLLLGFGAGVLNVMRSAGVVAEFGQGDKSRPGRDDSK